MGHYAGRLLSSQSQLLIYLLSENLLSGMFGTPL